MWETYYFLCRISMQSDFEPKSGIPKFYQFLFKILVSKSRSEYFFDNISHLHPETKLRNVLKLSFLCWLLDTFTLLSSPHWNKQQMNRRFYLPSTRRLSGHCDGIGHDALNFLHRLNSLNTSLKMMHKSHMKWWRDLQGHVPLEHCELGKEGSNEHILESPKSRPVTPRRRPVMFKIIILMLHNHRNKSLACYCFIVKLKTFHVIASSWYQSKGVESLCACM